MQMVIVITTGKQREAGKVKLPPQKNPKQRTAS